VITSEASTLQLMDMLDETPATKAASVQKQVWREGADYIIEVLEYTYWRIEGKNGRR